MCHIYAVICKHSHKCANLIFYTDKWCSHTKYQMNRWIMTSHTFSPHNKWIMRHNYSSPDSHKAPKFNTQIVSPFSTRIYWHWQMFPKSRNPITCVWRHLTRDILVAFGFFWCVFSCPSAGGGLLVHLEKFVEGRPRKEPVRRLRREQSENC